MLVTIGDYDINRDQVTHLSDYHGAGGKNGTRIHFAFSGYSDSVVVNRSRDEVRELLNGPEPKHVNFDINLARAV